MAQTVTFIHAADLHIGAPFTGLRALSESWANRLLSAIAESYNQVIEAALKHKVDFVIIAGDIFDSERTSYADYLIFFEGLKKLDQAGIPVYLCTGNHDPYVSWQHDFLSLPLNTTMFSADKPSFALYERAGEPLVLLGGRGFYNKAWPTDEDISLGITRSAAEEALGIKAPFALGVLHTGLNMDPSRAPTNPPNLMSACMNYWALGHIHIPYAYPETNPHLVFSGCIQGRGINETGQRGVYKVTLQQDAPNELEFIPTASVVWEKLKVDITECLTLTEVEDKIVRELFLANSKSHCEEMCVRVTLGGKTALHKMLASPDVLNDMTKNINNAHPSFFCDALIDTTVFPLDKHALEIEGLFPSVFLQSATALCDDKEEALAYLQDEFVKKGLQLSRPTEKNVETLMLEAEDLVLDLLGQGEA